MKRCVIVGGAKTADYNRLRAQLKPDDFVIYCDSGLYHMDALGVAADMIVGDFDSHKNPLLGVETIVLPSVKDDTDTFYAAKEALKRGFTDFLLLGVTGQRLDHTLGNISILLLLDTAGARARIVDDYSEITVVSKEAAVGDSFAFFSLIAVGGEARGVNIENAKYPLVDAVITPDYQYGISNEVLPGQTAVITVKKGRLLLIKTPVG